MKKAFLLTILLLVFSCSPFDGITEAAGDEPEEAEIALFRELELEGEVAFEAFESAFAGYNSVAGRRRDVLTLIDFTKPSTEQRLWVIDMAGGRVLFRSHVAHGQGSGENYATRFSNVSGSHQSSPGLYLTGDTYIGRNGYSMLLDGLEPGVNDNARARAIVVHGADYADPEVIPSTGRLGRSWGCPALPRKLARPIIDSIKGGSVLYIYAK
jgi:hypothetical protein